MFPKKYNGVLKHATDLYEMDYSLHASSLQTCKHGTLDSTMCT